MRGGDIDVALIAIPAAGVPAAAEECAAAGVKHLIIISAGFAEEGDGASAAEAHLLELSRRTGMRISGPNCEGYWNAIARISTTFSPAVHPDKDGRTTPVSRRRVGIIAQSGGIGFALFDRGRSAGLDFSYVVTTGNEVDLTTSDYLEYMVQDPQTDIILLFCEGIRDGNRFTQAAAAARRAGKPIIAVKVGRSEAGQRAAASHTAALSGTHSAYQAVFERYGIIECDDPDDAVAIAGTFATSPLPRGARVGVITPSGGAGGWMADTLSAYGLSIPELSPALQGRIRSYTPSYAAPQNPVDTTAQGAQTADLIMRTMELLEASDEVDSIVVVNSLASETSLMFDPVRLRPMIERMRKPITVWSYNEPSAFGRRQVAECGMFLHNNLRSCGVATGALAAYRGSQPGVAAQAGCETPAPFQRLPAQMLTEHAAKELLAEYRLPFAPEQMAASAEDAVRAAVAIGMPVALKIQSPDIPHKTEAGGVRLGLSDRDGIASAYDAILEAAGRYKPGARIDGVLVQRMAPAGLEFAVGVVNDETFGPIIMVGAGGTTIELFGDVVHASTDLDQEGAIALVRKLKSARLMDGFRGGDTIDIAPLAAFVVRIAAIARANAGRFREMEFNPVIVDRKSGEITIADALVLI